MVRIVTQVLMGLMLLFGTITITPKLLLMLRQKNLPRALYYLILWCISLAFALMAFYAASA
ncbi:MAG: hypothetical protein HQL08_06870 [Nitrospirae bacterium]|nr:hypothetical protein [Nitrospirota bacterium]